MPDQGRLTTGVVGLDRLLNGGLTPRSVTMIQGPPGTGKTVLANQLAFHRAAQGDKVVYVTLLSESHDRMLSYLANMDFFDRAQVPSPIYYFSAYQALINDGHQGVLKMLANEIKCHKANVLILDGFYVLVERTPLLKQREFVNEVVNLAGLMECTVLLLTNADTPAGSPDHTMADGWIELGLQLAEYRAFRTIKLDKYRGSDFIPGLHMMSISGQGIRVFPRLESAVCSPPAAPPIGGRVSSGIPQLDRMMGGGLVAGSGTLIMGATGLGKTTFGMHFLVQCSLKEPGLAVSFSETAERMRQQAHRYGLPLGALLDQGVVEIIWKPATELLIDELAYQVLEEVDRRGIRRLVIDGINGLSQAAIYKRRMGPYLTAFTNELRDRGVTALYTLETAHLIGGAEPVSIGMFSPVAENVLLLGYVEEQHVMGRQLSIIKVRESAFDHTVHSFTIGAGGVAIGEPRVARDRHTDGRS